MKKYLGHLSFGLLFFIAFTACNNDQDEPYEPDANQKNILISSRLPTPDGTSGTTYTQLIENIDENTYNNKNAYEQRRRY